jgi:hypothetical protein
MIFGWSIDVVQFALTSNSKLTAFDDVGSEPFIDTVYKPTLAKSWVAHETVNPFNDIHIVLPPDGPVTAIVYVKSSCEQ